MKRSIGTILAATTEILFGLMFLATAAITLAVPAMMRTVPDIPRGLPSMGFFIVTALFYAAVGAVAIATAIGVLKGMNWARLLSIVAGALLAFFTLMVVVFTLFMPLPAEAAPQMNVGHFRAIMAVIFGVPGLIGAWWVILFTRRRVVAMFQSANGEVAPSRRPLSISVLAVLYMLSGAWMAVLVFVQHAPAVFFGKVLPPTASLVFYLASGVVFSLCGIGLWRLDRRAWVATLALLVFGLLNGGVTWLLPGRAERMEKIVSSSSFYRPEQREMYRAYSSPYFLLPIMFLSVAIPGYFLVTRRAAFTPAPPAPPPTVG